MQLKTRYQLRASSEPDWHLVRYTSTAANISGSRLRLVRPTEAFTLTQLDVNSLGSPVPLPSSRPSVFCPMLFLLQLTQCILAWHRHRVMLHCIPVACLHTLWQGRLKPVGGNSHLPPTIVAPWLQQKVNWYERLEARHQQHPERQRQWLQLSASRVFSTW